MGKGEEGRAGGTRRVGWRVASGQWGLRVRLAEKARFAQTPSGLHLQSVRWIGGLMEGPDRAKALRGDYAQHV